MHTRAEASSLESPAAPRIGDSVFAQDGELGRVERVVTSERFEPAFLVVSVRRLARRRHPVVPWSLVRAVDRTRDRIYLRGPRRSLGRLSESVPIVL